MARSAANAIAFAAARAMSAQRAVRRFRVAHARKLKVHDFEFFGERFEVARLGRCGRFPKRPPTGTSSASLKAMSISESGDGKFPLPLGDRLPYDVELYGQLLLRQPLRLSEGLDVLAEHGAPPFLAFSIVIEMLALDKPFSQATRFNGAATACVAGPLGGLRRLLLSAAFRGPASARCSRQGLAPRQPPEVEPVHEPAPQLVERRQGEVAVAVIADAEKGPLARITFEADHQIASPQEIHSRLRSVTALASRCLKLA